MKEPQNSLNTIPNQNTTQKLQKKAKKLKQLETKNLAWPTCAL